jgi:hypothetical protein
MRPSFIVLCVAVVASSCGPKCETASRNPDSVCRHADAGVVTAGQAFTLDVATTSWGTCTVQVDGGAISLAIESTYCEQQPFGFSDVAAPRQGPTTCQIPALAAGSYVITSDTPTTFSIPASADAGIPNCP